jgi:hypothetical protein
MRSPDWSSTAMGLGAEGREKSSIELAYRFSECAQAKLPAKRLFQRSRRPNSRLPKPEMAYFRVKSPILSDAALSGAAGERLAALARAAHSEAAEDADPVGELDALLDRASDLPPEEEVAFDEGNRPLSILLIDVEELG